MRDTQLLATFATTINGTNIVGNISTKPDALLRPICALALGSNIRGSPSKFRLLFFPSFGVVTIWSDCHSTFLFCLLLFAELTEILSSIYLFIFVMQTIWQHDGSYWGRSLMVERLGLFNLKIWWPPRWKSLWMAGWLTDWLTLYPQIDPKLDLNERIRPPRWNICSDPR